MNFYYLPLPKCTCGVELWNSLESQLNFLTFNSLRQCAKQWFCHNAERSEIFWDGINNKVNIALAGIYYYND